ncbi:hypothetical protein ACF0H5_018325 [Mactra antiquata]
MSRLSKEDRGRAIGMTQAGSTQRNVARALHCDKSSIRRLWNKYRETDVDEPDCEPDCISVRDTLDKTTNSHGIKLLDLCKSSCLRIVLGRIGISQNFTFMSRNGTSVIDYLLCHERHFSNIKDFSIGSFNELQFVLSCNNIPDSENSYKETKSKWNDTHKQQS